MNMPASSSFDRTLPAARSRTQIMRAFLPRLLEMELQKKVTVTRPVAHPESVERS